MLRLALRQWWLILLLPFGLTSWIAFLYVGLRVRRWRWVGFGVVYLVGAYVLIDLDAGNLRGFATLVLWLGSAGHGLYIRREFLHLVEARRNPSRAGTFQRPSRADRDYSISKWSITLLCVFFMGLGAWTMWESLSRPGEYETLERRGVVTQAKVSYHEQFSSDDDYYTLELDFRGEHISETYHNNVAQFRDVPEGGTVPVMVDPEDPDTVFTVTDIRERTNAGFGVLFFFGVGVFLVGFIWLVSHIRENRRFQQEMDAIGRRW